MSQHHADTFMRFASPNERRVISREDVGFYNAVVIGAVYELAGEYNDLGSIQSFVLPLRHCILQHPWLSVVIKDKHVEKPFYAAVASLNLEDHISIIHEDSVNGAEETEIIERVLPSILDRPFVANIPPWRITVLPLVSPSNSKVARCFIAFAFSHALGDGVVGLIFHRTFLQGWRQKTDKDAARSISMVTPLSQMLPAPFDTPERITVSWNFLLGPLLAVCLPTFLAEFLGLRAAASTVNAGTWIGPPIFVKSDSVNSSSRVRLLEIDATLVQKALRVSREHDAKLTATFHQLIVRGLSKAIPNHEVLNFVSGTAVDMRGSIGVSSNTWGLFVSGHYEVHPRIIDNVQPALSDDMWAAASSITKRLAECGARLHNQAIGLLRYAPSIRSYTLGKVGHQRDSSYELSNLLAFDNSCGSTESHECNISKMVFVQPENVLSAPLVFNIVSVKGGSLVCAVSWQAGALGVPMEEEQAFVDQICSSIRADFENLL